MTFRVVLAVALCAAAAAVAGDTAKHAAAKPEAHTILADQVKYGPVPPALPPGAQIAVLHGDPFKKGVFAVRLQMPDGYRIPPHWHTQDEQLTILSGTFKLGMGDKFDEASMQSLGAGSYHFLPGKMHHYAAAQGATVLELHGMGPFDIHYLNPADDPSKKASAAK
jgi:quercetin dioxygenase-like cupin family protein